MPKKRKNMKELNKKEAIGDLLDAFTEVFSHLDELKCLSSFSCIYNSLFLPPVFCFRSKSRNLLLNHYPLTPALSLKLRKNLPQRVLMRPGKNRKTNRIVNLMGLKLHLSQMRRKNSLKKVACNKNFYGSEC